MGISFEIQAKFDEMNNKIIYLENELKAFKLAPQFSPEIRRTIGESLTGVSSKSAASGTQAVSEAGSASYNVMKAPTGFIKLGDKNIPYIT